MPIFNHNHLKVNKVILNFPEFASACKKLAQIIHFIQPFTLQLEWPQPFLSTPTPVFFYQLLTPRTRTIF